MKPRCKCAVVLLILSCFISSYSGAQLLSPQNAIGVCDTYTFRLQLGNGNYENHINDVSTFSGSGLMYNVGYTNINGNRDALLQMLDRTGQIIWSKTWGIPGRTEVIEGISLMKNGNMVMTGTLEQADNQKPFIMTTAPDGTVLWMKVIATPTSYRGKAVVATRLDSIGFAAEDDSTVVFGTIDKNGSLKWMRKMRLLQSSRVLGITSPLLQDYAIAFTGTDTGRKVGGVVWHRSFWNNAIMHKLGGVAKNMDFILHKMQMANLRPRVTGIYSVNNGPYKLFRGVFNGRLQGFETYTTPGINFDETAFSAITSWVDVVAFTPTAGSSDLYAFSSFTSWETDGPYYDEIFWAKKFDNVGGYRLTDLERTFDAGNVAVFNGVNKALMLKMDSIGLSPGCDGLPFSITKTTDDNFQGEIIEGYPHVTVNYPLQDESLAPSATVIDTSFQCRELTCPPPLLEDTCGLSFYRIFRSTKYHDYGTSISVDQNKNILLTGITRDFGDARTSQGIFVRFDSAARLTDRKVVTSNAEAQLGKHIVLSDGSIVTIGNIIIDDTTGYIAVSKFSPSLTLIWNRSFQRIGSINYIPQILESEGNIFVTYHEGYLQKDDIALMKLDANGNLLWVRNYRPYAPGPFGGSSTSGAITQDAQHIYHTAHVSFPIQATVLMKTEKSSGNMVWAKQISHPSFRFAVSSNALVVNDKILLVGSLQSTPVGNITRTALVMLDKNGNLVRSGTLTAKNTNIFSRAAAMSNGDVVLTGYYPDNSVIGYGYMSAFVRLDSNLQVRYSKRSYDVASGSPSDVKEAYDGSIYEAGSVFFRQSVYSASIFVRKRTFDGTLGNCYIDSLVVETGVQDPVITPVNFTPATATSSFQQFTYTDGEYTLQENHARCASPVFCTQVKVTGPQNVCRDTTYEYRIQRNAGCNAASMWLFSGAQVQVVAVHDSMVRVKFLTNGNVYVKARLFTGCRWIEDSLQVGAFITDDSLNLGTDGSICPGNTRVLRAGPNFQTYQWQDGSTDSVFTVTQPGTYYVTTTNGCGDVFSDTVVIGNGPSIPFELGPDVSKCNNDSLTITAPAGFMNYQWSPANNISSTTGQSVIVFPATTTMYKVMAEKTPGCFAYDSITVQVNSSLPVNIGADTSFCNGDSVVLYAGSGFSQYQWSTGATSDRITVKNKGRYFVVATAANLCRSFDTLEVLNVFANPVVNLSKDSLLCTGDSKTLNAGNGFLQYTWHDGSTASSITVNAPGKFWVTVKDANSCHGSDTTAITRLLPLPANFLPADTTLCTYSKLIIVPAGSFKTYAWSTGAISSTLTVDKAGIYSLRAQDNFGCEGTDEMVISPKDCLKGIFFPNAFTPNRDRKNDTFKPVVYGLLVNFQLTIYNRWGGRIFETRDWQTGWNGTIAGVQQQSDTFLWVCTYQFQNEPAKIEKGTVVLVR